VGFSGFFERFRNDRAELLEELNCTEIYGAKCPKWVCLKNTKQNAKKIAQLESQLMHKRQLLKGEDALQALMRTRNNPRSRRQNIV